MWGWRYEYRKKRTGGTKGSDGEETRFLYYEGEKYKRSTAGGRQGNLLYL